MPKRNAILDSAFIGPVPELGEIDCPSADVARHHGRSQDCRSTDHGCPEEFVSSGRIISFSLCWILTDQSETLIVG